MRSMYLSIVLCACGSSSSPETPGTEAPAACTPTNNVIDLATDHGWALWGMRADARGPWVLVEKKQNGLSDYVILDGTGEVATLASGIPDSSGTRVEPVSFDGKRCVAMHTLNETFSFACEGSAIETPPHELGGDMRAVATGTTLHVFGQQFAAYHELRRDDGTWRQVEKFESSISEAEDAITTGGGFASCFLSTGGKASIDQGGSDFSYGTVAKWCRLIPGDTIGVLTDKGLSTFSGGAFTTPEPSALAADRPVAVGRVAGQPVAVVRRGTNVELQPLPNGTPTVLRAAESAENAHAAILSDRIAVFGVKALHDTATTRYQLIASTHCL